MTERTEGSIVIAANPSRVMDVITDYEAYPSWAEVRSCRVLERGEGGLATKVAFDLDVPALGRTSYTLAYRYAGDEALSWVSTEAHGAVSSVAGEYLLSEEGEGTRVTYRLAVELGVLLPGVVRAKGEQRLIANALESLKRRVEES